MDYVIASHIDKHRFSYLCTKCSSYTLKNGKPRKKPKLVYHHHGNDLGFKNRTEYRGTHHLNKDDNSNSNVCIYITDDTKRM